MPDVICPICNTVFYRRQCGLNKIKSQATCSMNCRTALRKRTTSQLTEKRCTQCKETKPIDDFHENYRGKVAKCKKCICKNQRDYRKKNPKKVRESKKRYYEQNRDAIAKKRKQRYRDNRTKVLERAAIYRDQHRDTINQWYRNNYINNKKRILNRGKQYYLNNREKIIARSKKYRQRPDSKRKILVANQRYKARKKSLSHTLTVQEWDYAMHYWNGRCAVCGCTPGFWHKIAMDHWIPLSNPDCPGTIAVNIIPLCHGVGGCNNSKGRQAAKDWLVKKLGT